MDTDSRAQTSTGGGRSGGKIVKRRRYAAARTPYDRPPSPPPDNSGSNWFTGLVLPGATRMIAKGATKLISFMTDTSSRSSSSTDTEDEDEDDVVSCDDDNDVVEKDSALMEMTNTQFLPERSPKQVIEKLLYHESFSREESDKLVEIIKSRVVDFSTMEGQGAGLMETPSRRFGNDTPDRCGKPVMEATHWLEEKKAGSGSKSYLDHGFSAFSYAPPQNFTKFDKGSPVDVAKSYMQARSAWASPSLRQSGSRTPAPIAIDLFKDENLFSVDSNSLPSAKKRDALSAGSWNIQDEIRKVRSKATEDMLRDLPSTRIDLSTFALEPKTFQDVPDNGSNGDKVHPSNPLPEKASVNLAASSALHDCTDISAFGGSIKQDGMQNELVSSNPPTSIFKPNQDLKSHQIVKEGTANDSYHSISLEHLVEQHNANDTNSKDESKELEDDVGKSAMPGANGAGSKSSLSVGMDTVQNLNQSGENEIHPVDSTGNKPTTTMSEEEAFGVSSEPSAEIQLENEINSTADGSQDLQDSAHEVDVDNGSPGKKGLNKKQPEKKRGRNQRKGRGR